MAAQEAALRSQALGIRLQAPFSNDKHVEILVGFDLTDSIAFGCTLTTLLEQSAPLTLKTFSDAAVDN